jgi:hypothetical protein
MGVDTEDPTAVQAALAGLDPDTLSDAQAVLLLTMRSIAAERLDRGDEALVHLQGAADRVPDDPDLQLHLGILLEGRGEIDGAVRAFTAAGTSGTETDRERIMVAARYLYLWDRPVEGLKVLEPLFHVLRDLGEGDDDALEKRGLPSLTLLLSHYSLFQRMAGHPERVDEMVGWCMRSLKGESVESACHLAVAFTRADEEAFGEWLADWTGAGGSKTPSPARRVAWALHRARTSDPLGAALRHIEAVSLEPNDPGWLKSLLAFGRAETFHRYDMEMDERPWKEKILREEPMLFEPEHVVRFGLFPYQEILKQAYRRDRA